MSQSRRLPNDEKLQIWKKDLILSSNCKSVVMKIKAISRHNYSFFALPVMCLPFLIRLIYHTRTILPASLMRRSLSSSSQNLVRTFALVWLQIWGSVELKVTNLIYEIFFLKVFLRLYRLCLDFFATMSLLLSIQTYKVLLPLFRGGFPKCSYCSKNHES